MTAPVRLLGIDFGTRRIGLALAEPSTGVVVPLETVDVRGAPVGAAVERIREVVREHGIDRIVVGLPVNMDGSEGPQAQAARAFGDDLAGRARIDVEYFDERLSTFAAETQLREAGMTREQVKARADAVAAMMILRGYLERRTAGPGDEPG